MPERWGRRRLLTVVHEHALSLVFGALFVAALAGQSFAGLHLLNEEYLAEGLQQLSWTDYVTSSDFAVDVAENWQSEYLQFLLYAVLTVWLLQRGSPESKEMDKAGRQTDEEQKVGRYAGPDSPAWARARGWRLGIYSNSLGLVMALVFLGSWAAQAAAGWVVFEEERLRQLQDPGSFTDYLLGPDLWSRSLQNWQSEFLAVGSMAVFAIYLRQRGSPESKPVGEPHDSTGIEG